MNEETQLVEENQIQPLPLEEQVSQELVKHNYTEAKLQEFEEYLKLDIIDNDKESYLTIKEKRKEVKSYRVAVEKFCKFKREDAVKIQKAWVAKENELVGKICKVEDYLEDKEKAYEKAIAEEKERKKRQQEEQLIMRQQELTAMGALYFDGNFVLGEVSFEMSLIRECDSDIWENDIKPKFEVAYQQIEAERIEQDRIKAEKEAELKKQQEELEQQRIELQKQQEQFRQAQEEQERKQREEEERKLAAAKEAQDAMVKNRRDQLVQLGMTYNFTKKAYDYLDISMPHTYLETASDEEFEHEVGDIAAFINVAKEKAEQKRLAEIEAQKEAERKKLLSQTRDQALKSVNYIHSNPTLLSELPDTDWDELFREAKATHDKAQREQWEKEQEEKNQKERGKIRMEVAARYNAEVVMSIEALGKLDEASFEVLRNNWQAAYDQAEEAKRVAKLEASKDKEKWDEMMAQVTGIEVYEMRSSQYRTKAKKFRDLLDQIKAL